VFFEPERTSFDLQWRMLGTWVRVHPWFWAMSAIMGWDLLQVGPEYLALWIACVFVSILLHEFGHIFAGRLFGAQGHIVLYGFGGLAVGSSTLPNRWQRIAVYLAGPLAGFALYGLIYVTREYMDEAQVSALVRTGLKILIWINVGWGILNLLPIWPLDGGQASRDFLDWLVPYRGVRLAYGISIVVAGLLALNALLVTWDRPIEALGWVPGLNRLGGYYTVFLFGYLAFVSYQRLQYEANRQPWDHDGDQWKG
jgi:stage IV sporulation protein FB